MDWDDDDPWGEEPAWARDDGEATSSEQKDSEGFDGGFGAQHILVLIDCHPSMFVPCIAVPSTSDNSESKEELMTPFDAALLACEKIMRLRVHYVATSKAGKRDGVGIVLYGTKPSPVASMAEDQDKDEKMRDEEEEDSDETDDEEDVESSSPLSSIHTLLPIAPPGIQGIRSLRDCLPDRDRGIPRKRDLEEEYADTNNDSGPSNVAQRMGHTTLCPLRSALHEANKAFVQAKCVKKNAATSKTPADLKTVWIFTNHDDPCEGNEDEKKLMVIVAKDSVENGIDISVWPLPRADAAPFHRALFFNEITTKQNDYTSFALERDEDEEGAFDLDDMLDNVLRQWKKVRRVCSVPLLLPDWRDHPDDPGIMVDLFGIVQIQRKPQSVSIHQLTNKVTEKTTQVVMKDTGEVISDGRGKGKSTGIDDSNHGVERMRTFAIFGDDRVPVRRDELALIKKQSNATDKASLVLLGFKPIDSIPVSYRVVRSLLVYPNDDVVKGSTKAFANLYHAMIRKRVVALGELLQRATATSRLVALYPQQEKGELIGDESGAEKQVTPPGLVLVHLPFEDDVRAVDADLGGVATEESVDAAIELVKSQNLEGIEFGFSFDNVALARFWGYIESIAIGTPMLEEEDETKVDYESVKQVAGQQIEKFRDLLPEDVKVEESRKRKLVVVDGESPDWLELYKSGSLSDCTAPMLKMYLRDNGLKLSGKKADLVERVSQSLEEEMAQQDTVKPSVEMEEC